jgi:transcriptional regulator with PAS, ATPase and Fis domain
MDPTRANFAGKTLAQIEARAISEAFERHGGYHSTTVRELGVEKITIWRKIVNKSINLSGH